MCPSWDVSSGDLLIKNKFMYKKLEVKAFSSTGPITFGPSENWGRIYFVDATAYRKEYFKVYETKLSNISDIFSNIKINSKEKYKNHCDQKRRPRIGFAKLKEQLNSKGNCLTLIFSGYISCLID